MSKDGQDEVVAAEACHIAGVDRRTLLRWVQSGRLKPSRKLPGRTGAYLFAREAVEAAKTREAVPA